MNPQSTYGGLDISSLKLGALRVTNLGKQVTELMRLDLNSGRRSR
jgi:hypothetical protein